MTKRLRDEFGATYDLTSQNDVPLIIGRSLRCDVIIPPVDSPMRKQCSTQTDCSSKYLSISGVHAIYDPKTNTLQDLASSNGTRVRGFSLSNGMRDELTQNCNVELGNLLLTYEESA